VNDITDCVVDNVAVELFADDAKIYTVIDDVISSNQLQLSLDSVAAWADHWQLKLSPLKCSVMRLTGKSIILTSWSLVYCWNSPPSYCLPVHGSGRFL